MGGINKFLWLVIMVFLAVEVQARVNARATYRVELPVFKYKGYTLGGQTLQTQCDSAFCFFKINDKTYKVRRTSVRATRLGHPFTDRSFNQRVSQNRNSELGSSGGSRSYQSQTTRRSESSFAACYRRKGREYIRRLCPNKKDKNGKYIYVPSIRSCGVIGSKSPTRSAGWCSRHVRFILNDCGALKSGYGLAGEAKNSGKSLENVHEFTKLTTKDPSKAPVGSVIVYGNACSHTSSAGHIEIKVSENEYISDFSSSKPGSSSACRPVKGIYYKTSNAYA